MEDNLKYADNHKYDNDPKTNNDLKNEDDPKMKTASKINPQMKTTSDENYSKWTPKMNITLSKAQVVLVFGKIPWLNNHLMWQPANKLASQ